MTTYLGKSCSFCLPRVPFVNCRQFMYLVISLLVLRAGYEICLYQFLIIAYLFTFQKFANGALVHAWTSSHFQKNETAISYLLLLDSESFRPIYRFAYFPFRPDSFRPRFVSSTFPFAPESFCSLSRLPPESIRPPY